MIFPAILCGGSGERLWPLSRKSYPKQFLELVGDGSLFQQSATRITCKTSNPIIVTNNDYRFIVRQQLQEVGIEEPDVIIEPEGKNTAPAILVAALHVASRDPSGIMVAMPSDHYIPDQNAFTSMVEDAAGNIQDEQIICLGVQPSRPETGYGYIKVRDTKKQIIEVEKSVEKPSRELAEKYLSDGRYLWNAGIFIVVASQLLKLAEELQPDTVRATKAAYDNSSNDLDFIRLNQEPWGKIKGDSFDYASMEKASSIGCLSFKGDWSDLGDWNAVAREKDTDISGNNLIGNAHQIGSKNSLLWSGRSDQVLTGIGLENIIDVVMNDAVLVADKSKSQEVKSIIKTLKNSGQRQASDHPYEYRPWVFFKTIARGKNYHVKLINVLSGGKISLQSHKHRSEHWIVVKGKASVTKGESNFKLLTNESTFIPFGTIHMLQNNEPDHLLIIEVQIGYYLEKDYVIRYEMLMDEINNEPISIVVYGLGKIAIDQHIPAIYSSSDFQLAATISQFKSVPGVPSFSTLQELEESLIKVDAIALCMPPGPRHQISMNAIDAGYDLLLEKPPCTTIHKSDALFGAAQKAGVTIFASWHSKFAPMVDMAREWIEEKGCDHFQIVWNENVLHWHPGQKWISEPGGFGVLDSGINAFSILNAIFDLDFAFEKVSFKKPLNWETPIAASFQMTATTGLVGEVNFDWLTSDTDIWEIRFFSAANKMVLSHGGHKMFINDAPVSTELPEIGEYTILYNHFSNLVRNKTSDFDIVPLRFVEKLYEGACWKEVEAFDVV